MAINLHGVGDDIEVTLIGDHNASAVTFQLDTNDVAVILDTDPLLVLPYWLVFDEEQIEFTAIDTGADSVTVARGANGTTATTHISGTIGRIEIVAKQIIEIQTVISVDVWAILRQTLGGADGVLRNAQVVTFLNVQANGVPDMEFDMLAGMAFVNARGVNLTAVTESTTLVAPSANPRIDVVEIDEFGVMYVLTGTESGSPSAPSVTANRLGLAEIYHRVGSVHIDDVDDSSNSYITDKRGVYQDFL